MRALDSSVPKVRCLYTHMEGFNGVGAGIQVGGVNGDGNWVGGGNGDVGVKGTETKRERELGVDANERRQERLEWGLERERGANGNREGGGDQRTNSKWERDRSEAGNESSSRDGNGGEGVNGDGH